MILGNYHGIDTDDLAECIRTGVESEKYRKLQPLCDSAGNRVAALCMDVEIAQIHTQLRAETARTILMADVNGLKRMNDVYGHERGDTYLINCCGVLKDQSKSESA